MTKDEILKIKEHIEIHARREPRAIKITEIMRKAVAELEYFNELKEEIQNLEGIKLAQETALSKEYIIEEQLQKENAELKEISKLLLWDVRSGDYDAKDVERAERFLKECGLEGIM